MSRRLIIILMGFPLLLGFRVLLYLALPPYCSNTLTLCPRLSLLLLLVVIVMALSMPVTIVLNDDDVVVADDDASLLILLHRIMMTIHLCWH